MRIFLPRPFRMVVYVGILVGVALANGMRACGGSTLPTPPLNLTASWYSVESLKREGTWKTTKGVMANGHQFKDTNYTCASRRHKLGTVLRVTNIKTGKSVIVTVEDRIGARFKDSRIDLSKQSFKEIADLNEGVIKVKITVL